jgi:branched-chain amino acid transport system permease protein
VRLDPLVTRLRARPELAVPVVVVVATFFFRRPAPLGIYALGLVSACTMLLPALAIILVHRSNGVVNFAQVAIGTTTATLFTILTTGARVGRYHIGYFPLVRMIDKACGCVTTVGVDPGYPALRPGAYLANYLLAMVASAVFALVLTLASFVVVQRFARAPRVIVTVATIFGGQVVSGLAIRGPGWLIPIKQLVGPARIGFPAVPPPWHWTLTLPKVVFETGDIVAVAVTVVTVALLAVYVARSSSGTAIRAAAENPQRVATLGIDANRVVLRVWIVAGLLAAVTGVLTAMLQGAPALTNPTEVGSPLSVNLLVRILAIAVIARFASLPVAVGAAVALGVAEQAGRWSYSSTVVLDASLLLLIAITLLLQRRRASRLEIAVATSWQAEREIRPIPSELRTMPVVRTWVRGVIAIAVAFGLGLPWILNAAQMNLATLSLLYMMICLSLVVLTGWAGQISLGQVALAAIGAYVAARSGLPFVLALILGAVAGGIAATLVGIPALRLKGLNLAIITLAFAVSTSSLVLDRRYLGKHLPTRISRPSFLGLDLRDQRTHYYVMLLFLAVVAVAVLGMRRSRTARAFIALRDNEQAAQSFGISATRARLSAFAVSGAIAGFAGVLISYTDGGVDAARFTPDFGVSLYLAAVIGGFGSLVGPFLGGAYLGLLPLLGKIGTYITQFGGLAGLALMLIVGGGLTQLVFRVRDNMLRRVANRHGILVPSLVADARVDGKVHRVPIDPKRRAGGGTAFVPHRYRVARQWAFGETVPLQVSEDVREEVAVGADG